MGNTPETPMSDAEVRTHLANERTYLAWIRTVIVGLGIGLAAVTLPVKSRPLSVLADVLGMGVMVTSVILAFWALLSYRRTMRHLAQGNYRPAWGIALFALVLPVAIGAAVAAFFLAGR